MKVGSDTDLPGMAGPLALLLAAGLLAAGCSSPERQGAAARESDSREAPAAGTAAIGGAAAGPGSIGSAETLLRELGCGACHAGVPESGAIRDRAPPLGADGRPLDPSFLLDFLRDPYPIRQDIGRSRMPDFRLDEGESLALALFLAADDSIAGDGGEREEDRALRRAREAHPGVEAERGRQIFVALNCAGCHRHPDVEPRRNGPDLGPEAARVRASWLREWLARPRAVRPFGLRPGTGGRMPDFRLTPAETDSIAGYLLADSGEDAPVADGPGAGGLEEFEPRVLSEYERGKAEALLRDRLSCLGCHRLGEEGGRIGPDLGRAGERLRPDYLHGIIREPEIAAPGTMMPKVPLTSDRRDLIASYLAGRRGSGGSRDGDEGDGEPDRSRQARERAGYLSLLDHPLPSPEALAPPGTAATEAATGAGLYESRCAVCHGRDGEGDGYNARYLPVPPTVHASGPYISTRPSATLFDGIHAGGRILDRSHRMPPFGESLEPDQIWSLVDHIRELCDCTGPAWSR